MILALAVTDVLDAFAKLQAAGIARPREPKDAALLAGTYHGVLRTHSRDALTWAVETYIKQTEDRYHWPTVGKLNQLAWQAPRPMAGGGGENRTERYWTWIRASGRLTALHDHEGYAPCPVCGGYPTWADPSYKGRLFNQCDPEAHYRAGLPVIGNVPAGVDTGPLPTDHGDAWESA